MPLYSILKPAPSSSSAEIRPLTSTSPAVGERTPVIITVNGRGDTAVLGLQDYYQMKSELELLRTLAEAENDVKNGRVAPMQDTFDDIRQSLLRRQFDEV